ncbi:MAG: hypothetical protein QME32_03090 [Endomicrobiia bacterium]|nr:hypothetical protein [Endomicrobiia bacterium]
MMLNKIVNIIHNPIILRIVPRFFFRKKTAPRLCLFIIAAVLFLFTANAFTDDKEPVNVSEPVFRESPVAIEQQGDVSIAEPPLRKQTFIPDSPQFGLPDIPNIYSSVVPVEVERRLDFDWRAGNYYSNSSALTYLGSTGAARLDISVAALSSRGQAADGRLSRRAQSFRAAYADRSSSRFSLDIDADVSGKSVWTLERTFAAFGGAVKYHPADGAILSARASSQNIASRPSASDIPTEATYGDLAAEARFMPDADTDIYVGGTFFDGNALASKDFSTAAAGIDRVVFDKALLSAEAGNEGGRPHSALSATLIVADGYRVFVSRRSGYQIIKPADVFPDGLFVSAPSGFSWAYPELVAFSFGAECAGRSRTSARARYTLREIKNHFYLAASSSSAKLEPAYLGRVDVPVVSAEIKQRLGDFELDIGFLYNTGEPASGFPKIKTSSRLGYATKNISSGLTHTVETDRFFGVSAGSKAADIFLAAADAEIRLAPGLSALASIRNIFSTSVEIQPGFISDKPEYLLGVRASF